MSLAFQLIYATYGSGTHHKLALDSLRFLTCEDADRWRVIFLKNAETYVKGAKDPDQVFKDFKNHVLHVSDGYWGGAPEKSYEWYSHLITALREKRWEDAAYCAGVLSHYYMDPIQPFHTAQSEAENNIHRALEWSTAKAYEELFSLGLEACSRFDIQIPTTFDWLEKMVCRGAEKSHAFYQELIENYDFDLAVKKPALGLNDRARRILAELMLYACVSFARILEKAFLEARAVPPQENLLPEIAKAIAKRPVMWIKGKVVDFKDRLQVARIYNELYEFGRVEEYLPEDDYVVRELHIKEVLTPPTPGSLAEALSRFHLRMLEADEAATLRAEKREKKSRSRRFQAEQVATSHIEEHLPAEQGEVAAAPVQMQASVMEQAAVEPVRGTEVSLAEAVEAKSEPIDVEAIDVEVVPVEIVEPEPEPEAVKVEVVEVEVDVSAKGKAHARQTATRKTKEKIISKKAVLPSAMRGTYLKLQDDISRAPSIGPKTAAHLDQAAIKTVSDLLVADPDEVSALLKVGYITPAVIREWQEQAVLMCTVPELKGREAQILVGSGCRDVHYLAMANAEELMVRISAYSKTTKGERVIKPGQEPDLEDARRWIRNANLVLTSQAA